MWLPGGRLPTCRVAAGHAARRADDSQWRTGATRHMLMVGETRNETEPHARTTAGTLLI